MTTAVMMPEDLPQLVVNITYLNTMGFAGADEIAIFAFVMSLFSFVFNICLPVDEVRVRLKIPAVASEPLWGQFGFTTYFENPAYELYA